MTATFVFLLLLLVVAFMSRFWRRARPRLARLSSGIAAAMTTVLLVHLATYALMKAVPGGPFDSEAKLDRQVRAALEERARSGNDGVAETFGGLLTARSTPSLALRDFDSVAIVYEGAKRSAALGSRALVIAALAGVILGVAAATRGGWVDSVISATARIVLSAPVFAWAAILVAAFAFRLGWTSPAAIDGKSLGLACVAASLPTAAGLARLVRDEFRRSRCASFVRAARTRGVRPPRLSIVHALPASLVPAIAFMGPASASLLTGTLAVEAVFGLPGLGTHMVQAALSRDFPVVAGAAAFYAAALGVCGAISDAAAAAIDPRRLDR